MYFSDAPVGIEPKYCFVQSYFLFEKENIYHGRNLVNLDLATYLDLATSIAYTDLHVLYIAASGFSDLNIQAFM